MDDNSNAPNSPENSQKAKFSVSAEFNTALFLGCFFIALGIYFAGGRIANTMVHGIPWFAIGGSSGSHFIQTQNEPGEFMTEHEAARFIGLEWEWETFNALVESGELSGTYTAFQVERPVWHGWSESDWALWSSEYANVGTHEISVPVPAPAFPDDYEMVDHRVFCRERLTEWMSSRFDN